MTFNEMIDDGKCIGLKIINNQVIKRFHIVIVSLNYLTQHEQLLHNCSLNIYNI